MEFPGWIALDIDGTLTFEPYTIPDKMKKLLQSLCEKGWKIAFVTGRSVRFARMALDPLEIPYLLIPQNGTGALLFPEKKELFHFFLSFSDLLKIDEILQEEELDLVVYLGFAAEDLCYFRKKRFSSDAIKILESWQMKLKESWKEVDFFEEESIPCFATAKSYAPVEKIERVCKKLKAMNLFSVSYVRDLYHPGWAILFMTHPLASKGQAFSKAISLLGRGKRVIAAGDDDNDRSLFEVADFKIAMSHAPLALIEMADLVIDPKGSLDLADAILKETQEEGFHG